MEGLLSLEDDDALLVRVIDQFYGSLRITIKDPYAQSELGSAEYQLNHLNHHVDSRCRIRIRIVMEKEEEAWVACEKCGEFNDCENH